MRLWHKDLIPYLPQKQLVSQWRECCCIARNIATDGTPNHILVNKILDYPIAHLWKYAFIIRDEMHRRGYVVRFEKFEQWFVRPYKYNTPSYDKLFEDWHNDRYLKQCYYNLQEKYDCGGISVHEWNEIEMNCKFF